MLHYLLETGTQIVPNLYVGSIGAAKNYAWQKAVGITHVLAVTQDIAWTRKPPHIRQYRRYNVSDSRGLARYLDEIIPFIDHGRRMGKVLVHCSAGMNRSVCTVFAYLMVRLRMDARSSWQRIFSVHQRSQPDH
jgi:predicted protein tyrosine phosphatase